MPGALSGFTIIDLTQGLCGPFGSLRLGDAGAEVIKIEPLAGDTARTMGPPFIGDESAVFLSLNRNKKSLALEVQKPEGQDLVRRLTAKADVFLEIRAELPKTATGKIQRFKLRADAEK